MPGLPNSGSNSRSPCLGARWSARVCGIIAVLALVGCNGQPEPPASAADVATVPALRDALREDPDNVELRLQLARLYLARGDGASAESKLRQVLQEGISDERIQGDLIQSLVLQKKSFDALAEAEQLLVADGAANPRLWMLKGQAQLDIEDFDHRETLRSFIHAFERLRRTDDAATARQLGALAQREPVAAAARAHVDCRGRAITPIDPPAAAPAADSVRVLQVGPGRELRKPSDAARVARDGDIIEIDAGTYRGDAAVWTQNHLTLRGVGGLARLEAAGRHAQGKAIWVFAGDDITAENIEFSGAKVPNNNGAGIRLHGVGATIRNCRFVDNENGILGGSVTGPVPGNDVLIEFSSFERNGYGDGLTHNIYVGRVRSLTLRYSYSHASHKGHLVKSRALENAILFNRLIDGDEGDGSYVINLPEGGKAWIVGNELQQGPLAENPIMISFGEEKADREDQALFVVNNTFYNRVFEGTFVRNKTEIEAVVANNLFAGAPGILLRGSGLDVANERRPGRWLMDASAFDFRLTDGAPAIDAGTDPASLAGLRFLPDAEYRHPARGQARATIAAIDVGAHEYCAIEMPDGTPEPAQD